MLGTLTTSPYWGRSLVATLLLAALMFTAKWLFAAPLPPEMLFNIAGYLLGVPWVFNLVHSLPLGLDAYAKYALFGLTALGFFALWWVLGVRYLRARSRSGQLGWAALFVALMVLGVGLVLFPLQGLGLFGVSPNNFLYPPLAAHTWAALFGFSFVAFLELLRRRSQPFQDARRESLRTLALGMLLLSAGGLVGRGLLSAVARAQEGLGSLFERIRGLSPEITPTAEHYQVSKNVFNPSVREQGWSLRITGLVDNPLELTLDTLRQLPSVERSSTLTCISNPVGGDLIGNSVWTGVHLADLLEMAGVRAGASELILRAADNYSDSFPLEAALHEGTIVAYLQNGEPLTRDHGFPARVLVPAIYGMKNVKWVTEIELSDSDYQGYWQQRGWSDSAIVRTMSRIDTREATRLEDGQVIIGGVAFAGLRGIERVEVSLDRGESWQAATLKPAQNGLSWNLWAYRWPAEPGTYEAWVRATDGTGETQTSERSRPLPDGATGYHMQRVTVKA